MNHRLRPLAIASGVLLLLVIAAVGPFFPSDSIPRPPEVFDAPPVRRFPSRKADLSTPVEHYLPRETPAETSSFLASPIASPQSLSLEGLSPQSLSIDAETIAKARVFLDSHDHSEDSQKQIIDRGFQQYLGRSPSDSEAQAGLQALREHLSR